MKHVQVAAFSLTQGRFTRSSVCTGNTSLQRRLRFAFQRETTSVLAVLLSRIYICGMAQHGHIVVFTLAVLLLSSLFFSEWFPQSSSTTSYSQRLLLSDSQFKHQRQDIQRLLLTPTFTTHLIWIVGLLSLLHFSTWFWNWCPLPVPWWTTALRHRDVIQRSFHGNLSHVFMGRAH